ncbi:hypothetical protein WB388_40150 [Streptomyces brasiliscabiei]|uniref:Uncharacterized protein n=1 Tax=Streptomyces brasiliscabiei TaxID=2736302 RepID=A0ABU8GPX3_9ACTN
MPLTPYSVHDMAEAVLGCVCAALDATAETVPGQPGCPCRTCVVPGAVAWDGCGPEDCAPDGEPGQLTVSVARIYPAGQNFPAEDRTVQGVRGCMLPPLTAAELIVTLLRCAPVQDEDACPPTCEEQTEAARILHVDASTLYSALWCCLPGLGPNPRRPPRFVIGAQRIVGPDGGCVGVEQRVTVALPGCGKCPGEDGTS